MSRAALPLPVLRPEPERRYEPFPLTDIQRAYWLGRNPAFELGRVGIHVYEEVEVEDLDMPRLDAAWRRVLSRHDMLRAVVLPRGDQRVLADAEYQIELLDLRGESAGAAEAHLLALRESMSHRVYSPTDWPMFSIVACRLDARKTRLFVSVDALNVDMGSFKIVFGEWVALYHDPGQQLPELHVSYRDYAIALNAVCCTDAYKTSQLYWEERARQLPPAPELPQTQPFSALTSQRFHRRSGRLDAAQWATLKRRAAHRGLTPSGVTLAVYRDVLDTWCAALEFTINVTLFNRLPLHPQIGDVVGDFTSVVLLRADGQRYSSRGDRAAALQRQLWCDVEHRWVSGIQVLRDVARLHGKSRGEALMPCVYTSTLSMKARGLLPLHALGTRVFSSVQTPQVSLDLQVSEECDDLTYHLDAVEALFPPGLLDDFIDVYGVQLRRLACEDSAWTESPRPLTPASHLARRASVNETAGPCRAARLEDVCLDPGRPPETPAVITDERAVTYAELDRVALAIASGLRLHGVHEDDRVAILMEKEWKQVAAAFGILRAGAAYVPIDPAWPLARREYVLENAGAVAVIASDAEIASECRHPGVVTFDAVARTRRPAELAPPRSPRGLAYVLYTSGSTGQPKGVAIEHQSVINRIDDVNERFGLERECVFGLTALHHDLSVYDVFGTLAARGTLVLPDPAHLLDPRHWVELMSRHAVTVWNSVPAFMEMLVAHLEATPQDAARLGMLRLVMLSGDRISVVLPQRIRALLPNARVVSLGGPTETTIWDICFPIDTVDPAWRRIPYGRPMRNAEYHVLDARLNPRPDWVPGELFIGGTGLARGYWDDPQKTDERFVVHPERGERLFRSGDVGRFLPDGTIDLLGRADHQLKVRGHRIEAGEVEHALRQNRGVKEAVVVTTGASDVDRRLIAYVVPVRRVTEQSLALASWKAARHAPRRGNPAAEAIALSPAPPPDMLEYDTRRSCRQFSNERVRLDDLSRLLSCLRPTELQPGMLPKYRYPSAGSLYTVQTFVYVAAGAVEGLHPGFHFYEPTTHALERLSPIGLPTDSHVSHNREIADESRFTLLLFADGAASAPIYGTRGREFAFVEAGCMAQLLMTEASACGLGLCPIGELTDTDGLRDALSLKDTEFFVLGFFGGVPGSEAVGSASRLKRQLAESLPDYMIPSEFVFLDRLPLSPNGKVDRSQLPEPSENRQAPPARLGSREEEIVSETVRQILRIGEADPDRPLLDLGANSLHLVQLATALTARVGIDVPVLWLLEHSTIRALARQIARAAVPS